VQYVYSYSVVVWAGKEEEHATLILLSFLCNKYLCSKHYLGSDYGTAERMHDCLLTQICKFQFVSHFLTDVSMICVSSGMNLAKYF
jgi:hypothetical protein